MNKEEVNIIINNSIKIEQRGEMMNSTIKFECYTFLILIFIFYSPIYSQNVSEYFPLKTGISKTFKYIPVGNEAGPAGTSISTIECIEIHDSKVLYRIKTTHLKGGDKNESYTWFSNDAIGNIVVCKIGIKPDMIVNELNPPMIVLHRDSFRKGTNWENISEAFRSSKSDSVYKITVYNDYNIESTSETINVPAGKFENCIKVKGTTYTDEGDTLDVQYSYYASGIGEVLSYREIPKESASRNELIKYSHTTKAK